jgi:hypothetical protein
MGELIMGTQASAANPGASTVKIFPDTSTNPVVRFRDANGREMAIGQLTNYSTAGQAISNTTRTYLTGSSIAIPPNKLQVGTQFHWIIAVTKTAAGTATSTIDICVGTAGTTADTARCSFTKPAGTAAADEGVIEIWATIRSIGASGVMVAEFEMSHNGFAAGAGTGHMTIPIAAVNSVSAGFDMTVANLIVGICFTAGASDSLTFSMVQAEAWNV